MSSTFRLQSCFFKNFQENESLVDIFVAADTDLGAWVGWHMRNILLIRACGATALALCITACGGGGGGQARPQPAPPPPPPPPPESTPPPPSTNYDTSEYRRSNAAVAANAITAYQAGSTGKGIKIGVVDSGINPALSEFAGRIDPASRDVAGNRGVSDEGGHGTAVTAVAAAARNDSGMQGVAFDATIISLRADSPGSCADTSDDGGCNFYDTNIAAGIDAARIAGAKVINLSLGGSAPGTTLLSAIGRAVNTGIVLVISAGNDGETPEGANPDPFALVPAQTYSGKVIIAGSVGHDDGSGGTNISVLSNFSNRAGAGADYYLTALGYRDLAPDEAGTLYLWSGTSFSAPTISGAVALMAQAFPNLTGSQIIEILFSSADDLGAPGIDPVFGHGRLNIAQAFQPKGTLSVAGTQVDVTSSTNGDMPAAAGDAASKGKMGAVILDGYSRAYAINLAATLKAAPQSRPLGRALLGSVRGGETATGPLNIAMTVAERRDGLKGFELEGLAIGPEDSRRARLIAGSAIATLDDETAVAFGYAGGAKAMERRLTGYQSAPFIAAHDTASDPGFIAARGGSLALRRKIGQVGITVSAESGEVWGDVRTSGTGSPYRWTSLAFDRQFGSGRILASLSHLDEKRTVLGGRMSEVFGIGGSTSLFLGFEGRQSVGSGVTVDLSARRGWTNFAGGRLRTAAYSVDFTKAGLFGKADKLGLRFSQPLRVESGGFAIMLPTAYDYTTGAATDTLSRLSMRPTGREVVAELSYGSSVAANTGWLGANLFVRREPGHIADADSDYGGAFRFSLSF